MTRAEQHQNYASQKCVELVDEAVCIRNETCLSQRDISDILGMSSHANIVQIENHKTVPRLDNFLRILSVLGYTLKIVRK